MPLLLVLFFLSGATGLVYELIWTRELIFVFGGTTYAITTVLVAFMGGLGLGSYFAGRVAARMRQPGRVYGLLELVIGGYALLVPILLGLAEPLYRAIYPGLAEIPFVLTALRFVLCALGLLLPTFCMGATLPILIRYVSARGATVGYSVGLLYGINTLGAVFGVVATGFFLIPTIGLVATTWTAAAANLAVGILAIFVLRLEADLPVRPPPADRTGAADLLSPELRRGVLLTFAISGFAAMVYQIMWTRALVMSIGSSTYSFTAILAAFILGLALGSLVLARRIDRLREPLAVLGWLQIAIAIAAVIVVPVLGYVPLLVAELVESLRGQWGLLLATEFALVIALVFVPTFLIGGVFPLVTRLIAGHEGDASQAAGRAYLVNTAGTIVGSFLAGFILIRSQFGLEGSVWLAAALNGVTGLWLLTQARALRPATLARPAVAAGALLLIPVLAFGFGTWDRALITSAPFLGRQTAAIEREILYYEDGADLTVCVQREAANPEFISMSVNGKTDASTTLADMPNMLMLGHLGPILSAAGGGDTCLIGLGGGLTLGALACHPGVTTIDCVEISEEVINGATWFEDYTGQALQDPRLEIHRADGRNHLLLTDRMYDVIISQPSNPWVAGVANLFTHEYFQLVRQRLKAGGVFVCWVQAYSTGLDEFRMIVRTLGESFGYLTVWDTAGGDYLFVCTAEPIQVDLGAVLRRLGAPRVRADLHRLGINHPGQFLGAFIASDQALRTWAADAPLHTDDNARLEFSAPTRLFASESYEIAAALADRQHSPFDDLLASNPDAPAHRNVRDRVERAAAARRLRDQALAAERSGDVLAQLKAYVDAYRTDPGNIGVSYNFHALLKRIQTDAPDLQHNPQARPYLEELNGYRGPMLAPLQGGTLPEIARFNTALGQQAAGLDLWYMASEYFEAALALRDSPELAQALAVSYSRSGRLDQAIALLEGLLARDPDLASAQFLRGQFAVFAQDFDEALKRFAWSLEHQAVSARELAENDSLAGIRNDPRFQALLERYAD